MTNSQRPIITLVVFAYNQEQYIAEAVQSALSQDYQPLEIILSDDASTDRTHEFICAAAASYKGPHTVRVRRSQNNAGWASHINAATSNVKGDLIVVAAGDDISEPHRVSRIVETWMAAGRTSSLLFSAVAEIDQASDLTGMTHRSHGSPGSPLTARDVAHSGSVLGASCAWTPELFRRFPPLDPGVVNEDVVLAFRAKALGGIAYIDEPLVRYRTGTGLSTDQGRSKPGRSSYVEPILVRSYVNFVQRTTDLKHIGAGEDLVLRAKQRRAEYLFRLALYRGVHICGRRRSFFCRRCRIVWLAREFLKWRLPFLIDLELFLFSKLLRRQH